MRGLGTVPPARAFGFRPAHGRGPLGHGRVQPARLRAKWHRPRVSPRGRFTKPAGTPALRPGSWDDSPKHPGSGPRYGRPVPGGGTLNTLIVRFGAAGYRPTKGFRQPSLGEMVRLGGLLPHPGGAYPGVCGWPAVTPPWGPLWRDAQWRGRRLRRPCRNLKASHRLCRRLSVGGGVPWCGLWPPR